MVTASGPLLRSAHLRDFNALGSVGRPVYASAPQVRATLRRQLGPEIAAMLAVPQIDETGETVDWYAAEGGFVVPWSSATAEERDAMRVALQAARGKVLAHEKTLCEDLKSRPAQGESHDLEVYARLLPHVLRIPDESHIYAVDGRPVVTFWGFTLPDLPDADPIRDLLPAVAAAVPAQAAAAAMVAVPATRPWWRRWWWLLPLLLLLALSVLFGLRSCAPEVLPQGLRPFLPGDAAVPSGPAASATHGPDGTLVVTPGTRGGGPGVVVEGTVPATASGVEASGGTAASGQSGASAGAETVPSGAAPSPDAETPKTQRPPAATTEPDKGKTDAPPSPKDKTDGGKPDASVGDSRKDGVPLAIPPQAGRSGDVGFLDGKWRSRGGLMDSATGLPADVHYAFKDGKGTVTISRPDGTVCTGRSSARMKDGKLVITGEDDPRCNDGTAYARSDVECTPEKDGRARCRGKASDGPGYSMYMGRQP